MSFNSDPNAGGLFTFTPLGTSPIPIAYVPSYQGDEGLILPFAEGSGSQAFLKNALVKLSSGTVVEASYATADPLHNDEVTLGFAMRAASGTAGTRIDVKVIRPDDVWLANEVAGTTFLTSYPGTERSLARPTSSTESSVQVVSATTTTNDVTILASNENDGPGLGLAATTPGGAPSPLASAASLKATSGGRIFVKFLEAQIEWSVTETGPVT